MGFTRDEVAMGLAIAGPDAADDANKIGAAGGQPYSSGVLAGKNGLGSEAGCVVGAGAQPR